LPFQSRRPRLALTPRQRREQVIGILSAARPISPGSSTTTCQCPKSKKPALRWFRRPAQAFLPIRKNTTSRAPLPETSPATHPSWLHCPPSKQEYITDSQEVKQVAGVSCRRIHMDSTLRSSFQQLSWSRMMSSGRRAGANAGAGPIVVDGAEINLRALLGNCASRKLRWGSAGWRVSAGIICDNQMTDAGAKGTKNGGPAQSLSITCKCRPSILERITALG